jgi:hypothetical protein
MRLRNPFAVSAALAEAVGREGDTRKPALRVGALRFGAAAASAFTPQINAVGCPTQRNQHLNDLQELFQSQLGTRTETAHVCQSHFGSLNRHQYDFDHLYQTVAQLLRSSREQFEVRALNNSGTIQDGSTPYLGRQRNESSHRHARHAG